MKTFNLIRCGLAMVVVGGIAVLINVPSAQSQVYTWSTISGSAGSPNTNDGIGSAARFNSPIEITVDGNTNIFVSDFGNNKIRKLVFNPGTSNWVVSTISTSIQAPHGIVSDTAGANLFVNQTSGLLRVKNLSLQQSNVWNVSDVVTTPYAAAGLAMDSSGGLFYPTISGNRIVGITPASQTWSDAVIAGPPFGIGSGASDGTNDQATFFHPDGVCSLAPTNIIVTDSSNNTVRQITRSGTNWVTTTIAGQAGNAGSADGSGTNALFSAPAAISLDASGNLVVADQGNNLIRRLVRSNGQWIVSTIGGLASATPGSQDGVARMAGFNHPTGIAVDASGRLFVCDYGNNTIRLGVPSSVTNSPPSVQIVNAGNSSALVIWPAGSGFSLQVSTNITNGPWTTVSTGLATNLNYSTTASAPQRFFRLVQ